MGMSYFASLYHVIGADAVRATAPAAYQALEALLETAAAEAGQDMDDAWTVLAALDTGWEQPWTDEQLRAIQEALSNLTTAFSTATGLTLMLGQVDSDVLRGSDLSDEWFWHVNAFVPNPACTAFEQRHRVMESWVHSCG